MSASVAAWISHRAGKWVQALHCADRECNASRSLWTRLCWPQNGIRLRGTWYCRPQCFEKAVREELQRARVARWRPAAHRIPVGLLLLSRGQLTDLQLRRALDAQREAGFGRLGDWLKRFGFLTQAQLTVALGLQWACPVLFEPFAPDAACSGLVPLALLQHFQMIPVRFNLANSTLYLAFAQALDYSALHAIEQMLACRTEACLASPEVVERELQRIAAHANAGVGLVFTGEREVSELANIVSGYALKLAAEDVRIVSCGDLIWTRLQTRKGATSLLFPRFGLLPAEAFPNSRTTLLQKGG